MRKDCLMIVMVFIIAIISDNILAEPYNPGNLVARIPFGSQAAQVGVSWGIACISFRDFQVLSNGNMYCIDTVNGKIKVFSKDGHLLEMTEGYNQYTSFHIDQDDDSIYANNLDSNTLDKFDGHGIKCLSWNFNDLIPPQKLLALENRYHFEALNILSTGYLIDRSPANEFNIVFSFHNTITKLDEPYIFRFNTEGHLLGIKPFFFRYGNGGFFTDYDPKDFPNYPMTIAHIHTFTLEERPIKQLTIDITADHGIHCKGYDAQFGIDVLADERGGYLTSADSALTHPAQGPLQIPSESFINRYDENGKFLEQFRCANTTPSGDITVSPSGIIYYILFDKKYMNIMAYDSPFAKQEHLPGDSAYNHTMRQITGTSTELLNASSKSWWDILPAILNMSLRASIFDFY